MARAVAVASGTADAQAFTGKATLVGVCVRESAGSPAAASLYLRDGTSTSGAICAAIGVPASSTNMAELPAVEFSTGIFVDRLAGSTELVLYLL